MKHCVCIQPGIRHRLDGAISEPDGASSRQFYEIQSGGWLKEVLHVTKTKTVRKWELNTSNNFMNLRAEDAFVGRCTI